MNIPLEIRFLTVLGAASFIFFIFLFRTGTALGQDADIIEQEVPRKPTSGFGRGTQLLRDEVRVGEREYYDNEVLHEEKLFSNTKEAPYGSTLDGKSRKWHRNGNLWQEWTYEQGDSQRRLHELGFRWEATVDMRHEKWQRCAENLPFNRST